MAASACGAAQTRFDAERGAVTVRDFDAELVGVRIVFQEGQREFDTSLFGASNEAVAASFVRLALSF